MVLPAFLFVIAAALLALAPTARAFGVQPRNRAAAFSSWRLLALAPTARAFGVQPHNRATAISSWRLQAEAEATATETETETLSSSRSNNGNTWQFRGHNVYAEKTTTSTSSQNQQPAVVLIHGFGCSTTYWRQTQAALEAAGYGHVHALDLLGQGQSAKPGRSQGIEYSIRLWADQVDQYIREHIPQDQPVVLCGNSLGSLVALTAATGDHLNDNDDSPWNVAGICMFNCGVGLNSRGIANEEQWTPLQRQLINGVYSVFEWIIFRNTLLLNYVLEEVVTKDLLRDTLQSLYKHKPEHVDDELVDSFYNPAQDEGSVEALSQIYVNDPGRTPMSLHQEFETLLSDVPIHLVWGDDDAVTPVDGGVGQFYYNMAQDDGNRVSFELISSGHIPFDDNPEASHRSMLEWMQQTVKV